MSEKTEEICVQRFLNWYNRQHKGHYVHQRATTHFPDLNKNNEGDWDFVAYERGNLENWIGIEIKDLATTREVSSWFEFWNGLCSELTKDLKAKGIKGVFYILPPVLQLSLRERPKLRKAIIEVLFDKQSILRVNEGIDIGPDIWAKFAGWPKKQKSKNPDEYDKWGEYRPSELKITRRADSGCEVTLLTNPIVARDAAKQHKKTFDEADIEHANKQLNLAKEKGARETILLFACYPFIYEDLIKNEVQNLDPYLISDIDCIYLVDMGSKGRVIKIYPN